MKKQIRIFGKIFQYTLRVKRRRVKRVTGKSSRKNYLEHKEAARTLALDRIEHFNKIYATRGFIFKVGHVSVRNQKTRWGSCSKKGNLNFNYRIALLPPLLADYVIVHELCHIGEFNHSQNFWDLVGVACPDYLKIRQELKEKRLHLS